MKKENRGLIIFLIALIIIIGANVTLKVLEKNRLAEKAKLNLNQAVETPLAGVSLGGNLAPNGRLDVLNEIFNLDQKKPGTKIYYSENLGVGFTYLPLAPDKIIVAEKSDQINLDGQFVQVFSKDPNLSLSKTISEKFLQGYDSKICFVRVYDSATRDLGNYITAGISFPPNTDPQEPWWTNGAKCPQDYSETNGERYFVMNPDVPGKFAFVSLGQAAVATDGTLKADGSSFDWSHSFKIFQ